MPRDPVMESRWTPLVPAPLADPHAITEAPVPHNCSLNCHCNAQPQLLLPAPKGHEKSIVIGSKHTWLAAVTVQVSPHAMGPAQPGRGKFSHTVHGLQVALVLVTVPVVELPDPVVEVVVPVMLVCVSV